MTVAQEILLTEWFQLGGRMAVELDVLSARRDEIQAKIAKCDKRLKEPMPAGVHWEWNDGLYMAILHQRDALQRELAQVNEAIENLHG